MQMLLIAVILLGVCIVTIVMAFVYPVLGQETCNECGGVLTKRLARHSPEVPTGDWACPKCGTRFDPQGRAREPIST